MKTNSWLYHYYMVQSRLQYSLAYGGQSPTSLAAFYPGMQNASATGFPPGQSPFDGHHMLHASFMASPQGGVSHYSGYAGYTPPPGAYNIHQHYQVDQRSSESPLDFSAAASQYGNNATTSASSWNDAYEDNKVIGFNDVNPSNGVDRTSSPDYRYSNSNQGGWVIGSFMFRFN